MQGVRKFGGGGIMVWGLFLILVIGEYAEFSEKLILASIYTFCRIMSASSHVSFPAHSIIYQDDNDRKHTDEKVAKWQESVDLDRMPWPLLQQILTQLRTFGGR